MTVRVQRGERDGSMKESEQGHAETEHESVLVKWVRHLRRSRKCILNRGTVLGDVTRGVVTNVGTGMLMTKLEGEPDTIGTPTGLSVAGENQLGDLAVAYSEANVRNLEDIYKTNYFGTADIGLILMNLYFNKKL